MLERSRSMPYVLPILSGRLPVSRTDSGGLVALGELGYSVSRVWSRGKERRAALKAEVQQDNQGARTIWRLL